MIVSINGFVILFTIYESPSYDPGSATEGIFLSIYELSCLFPLLITNKDY